MDEIFLWSRRTRLSPTTSSVGKARDFTSQHLAEHELDHLIDDVRLVTSELAANAVRHAKTRFTVVLEGDDRRVRVTVSDDSSSRPVMSTPSPADTDGWGLRIVESFSRGWGVIDGTRTGKSVWASFDIAPWA